MRRLAVRGAGLQHVQAGRQVRDAQELLVLAAGGGPSRIDGVELPDELTLRAQAWALPDDCAVEAGLVQQFRDRAVALGLGVEREQERARCRRWRAGPADGHGTACTSPRESRVSSPRPTATPSGLPRRSTMSVDARRRSEPLARRRSWASRRHPGRARSSRSSRSTRSPASTDSVASGDSASPDGRHRPPVGGRPVTVAPGGGPPVWNRTRSAWASRTWTSPDPDRRRPVTRTGCDRRSRATWPARAACRSPCGRRGSRRPGR